jgi:hypothetical protein
MGPDGLPDNAGYFQAAYVAVALVYLVYALLLVRRRARARRALGAQSGARPAQKAFGQD